MRDATGAGLAMLRRDAAIFLSYRTRVITVLVSALFSVVLFHFISRLVHTAEVGSPDAYFASVVVGLVVLEVLTSVVVLPGTTLRQELVAGTFERLVLSPLGPVGAIFALLAFPFAFSLASAGVTLLAAIALFGLDLHWATAALALPLALLGALAFAPFGVLVVSAGMQAKQAAIGASFVVSGISIVSGAYFPPSVLPGWLRWTFDVQPFSAAIELMRHVLLDSPMRDAAWLSLAKLAGSVVVLLPASLWLLRRAVTRARRRGTLLEY